MISRDVSETTSATTDDTKGFIKGIIIRRFTGVQLVDFKAIVNDVKTGKSYNVAVSGYHASSLSGKKIGEVVDGIFVNLPGYKLKITGGSDNTGTPMRGDMPGPKRRTLLMSDGFTFY